MNDILKLLLGKLATEKGRDANRTLVFLLSLYTAWLVTTLDKRVAVLEARSNISALERTNSTASHTSPTNDFFTVLKTIIP